MNVHKYIERFLVFCVPGMDEICSSLQNFDSDLLRCQRRCDVNCLLGQIAAPMAIDDDASPEIVCSTVSLLDPLSMALMKDPVRGIHCNHLEAFVEELLPRSPTLAPFFRVLILGVFLNPFAL